MDPDSPSQSVEALGVGTNPTVSQQSGLPTSQQPPQGASLHARYFNTATTIGKYQDGMLALDQSGLRFSDNSGSEIFHLQPSDTKSITMPLKPTDFALTVQFDIKPQSGKRFIVGLLGGGETQMQTAQALLHGTLGVEEKAYMEGARSAEDFIKLLTSYGYPMKQISLKKVYLITIALVILGIIIISLISLTQAHH